MIGVFDSGIGGLYALRVLRRLLPQADLVYYADLRNLPYGSREPWEILALSRRATEQLVAAGAQAILYACGTVSSVALPILQREYRIPLFGVTEPLGTAVCRAAAARGGGVALLATQATVEAGMLTACVRATVSPNRLYPLPCPSFVPLAESGVPPSAPAVQAELGRVLRPLHGADIRTVALGCTHFSRFASEIGHLFPQATVVDGAAEAARAAVAGLPAALRQGQGACRLLTSGDARHLAATADEIFGLFQ